MSDPRSPSRSPLRTRRLLVPLLLCGSAIGAAPGGCEPTPATPTGELLDIAVQPNGKLATAGYDGTGASAIPLVRNLDPVGLVTWLVQLGGLLGTPEGGNANAVVVDSANTTYIGSRIVAPGPVEKGVVTAVNRFRAVLWETVPFAGAESEISAIALEGANLFVTGYARAAVAPGSDQGILLAKLRASDGAVLWVQVVESHPDRFEMQSATGLSIATGPTGNVGVTGLATQPSGSCAWVAAVYDPSGGLVWKDLRTGAEDLGADAGHLNLATEGRFDAAGNFYVAGVLFEGIDGSDTHLVKYDPSGTMLWDRALDAVLADELPSYDHARAVAVDPATGRSWIGGALAALTGPGGDLIHDGFVQSYDGAGNLLWTKQAAT